MAARTAAPVTEKDVINEFQSRRSRLQDVLRKVEELTAEVTDHDMVIKTLEPMEPGRRCFRLVGEVLVERTVGETLPAVVKHKENIEKAIETLTDAYNSLEKDIAEFQAKHQIRIVDRQGRPLDEPPQAPAGQGSSSKGGQGVLV